jgi:hypothetical protein
MLEHLSASDLGVGYVPLASNARAFAAQCAILKQLLYNRCQCFDLYKGNLAVDLFLIIHIIISNSGQLIRTGNIQCNLCNLNNRLCSIYCKVIINQ